MPDKYTDEGLPIEELERLRATPALIQRTDLVCGDCGAPLTLRVGIYGRFYGCTAYPKCKGSATADEDGTPLGHPADEATRRSRHRFIAAKRFAIRRKTYDGAEARFILKRPNGFSVGFLTKDECEKLVEHLCLQTDGLEEFLKELPVKGPPGLAIDHKSRWDLLMDPYDIFEAPLDNDDIHDIERGLRALSK